MFDDLRGGAAPEEVDVSIPGDMDIEQLPREVASIDDLGATTRYAL